ncbi:unnamed protein product, partial [marine sediment metagenome]
MTFADIDIVGDLGLTGNFTADGTVHSIDGSASIALITAALNITGDSFVVGDTTQTGSITLLGAGGDINVADDADIDGDLDVEGITNLDVTDIDDNLDVDGTTIVLDGSASVRGISAGFTSLEAPNLRFGLDALWYMNIAVTQTSGAVAITHTGSATDVTWTADSFDFAGDITLDGVTIGGNVSITGDITQIGNYYITGDTVQTGSFTITSDITTSGGNFVMGGTTITETEIAYLDGLTPGAVTANKAVVVDGSGDIATFGSMTA